jgi:DNA recombination protein RmuC
MTLLIAFIAGAACATGLILLTRWRQPAASPQLAELERAVQQIRVDQRGDSGELRGLVSGIVDQQGELVRQTGRLSEALRRPGVRGQWGESTLRRVVEAAGLACPIPGLWRQSLIGRLPSCGHRRRSVRGCVRV